jgi:hypothetical protein
MFASGITAPVASATCPEIDPEVCADILAGEDVTRNAKMQQAIKALHRPRNGAKRRFPDAPLTELFNMANLHFRCIEQLPFDFTENSTHTVTPEADRAGFRNLLLRGSESGARESPKADAEHRYNVP